MEVNENPIYLFYFVFIMLLVDVFATLKLNAKTSRKPVRLSGNKHLTVYADKYLFANKIHNTGGLDSLSAVS